MRKPIAEPAGPNLAELGKAAEDARTGYARASVWLKDHSDRLDKMVRVKVAHANFGNGTQQLENALQAVMEEHMEDLVTEAMQRMSSDADARVTRMSDALSSAKAKVQRKPDGSTAGTSP
jgi:hypothetical protein